MAMFCLGQDFAISLATLFENGENVDYVDYVVTEPGELTVGQFHRSRVGGSFAFQRPAPTVLLERFVQTASLTLRRSLVSQLDLEPASHPEAMRALVADAARWLRRFKDESGSFSRLRIASDTLSVDRLRGRPDSRVSFRGILARVHAGVAKLADAQDLKSCGLHSPCGFDPRPRHSISYVTN